MRVDPWQLTGKQLHGRGGNGVLVVAEDDMAAHVKQEAFRCDIGAGQATSLLCLLLHRW